MAQVVEYLPSKYKALASSNPSNAKINKKSKIKQNLVGVGGSVGIEIAYYLKKKN
jgi:hypothetical protein